MVGRGLRISDYVLTCVQNLRDQIRDLRRPTIGDLGSVEIEEILWAARGLSIAARTTGFNAYGCICLHLAERIEDLQRNSRISRSTLDLLSAWVEHSDHYLRHPSESAAVAALIELLNDPQWGSTLGEMEQGMLSRALLNPFAGVSAPPASPD
jgi:hypothetical protein